MSRRSGWGSAMEHENAVRRQTLHKSLQQFTNFLLEAIGKVTGGKDFDFDKLEPFNRRSAAEFAKFAEGKAPKKVVVVPGRLVNVVV